MRYLPLLLTALTSLVLSAFAVNISPIGNLTSFAQGCRPHDYYFWGNDKLGTYCFTDKVEYYDYKYSIIDLKKCIGSINGTLVAAQDGDFAKLCDDCFFVEVHFTNHDKTLSVRCNCRNEHGQKTIGDIDLNTVLKNNNGQLTCFDHVGTRENAPPKCFHNRHCKNGKLPDSD